MKINKETIKTIINLVAMVLSALASAIAVESCSQKVPLDTLVSYVTQ